MSKEKSPGLFAIVLNLARAYIKHFADLTQLASLEAKLAGKSLIRIIILIYLLGFVLTSTWLCILLILFLVLTSFHFTWLSAVLIITLFNIVMLSSIVFCILKLKDNLLFAATRRQLSNSNALLKKDS